MHFLTLDLKTKLITSERTFRKNLCRMVLYKVLQSKIEMDFFLKLILFSIVATGKEFGTTQNILQPELRELLLWKRSAVLKIILKILVTVSESGLVLQ